MTHKNLQTIIHLLFIALLVSTSISIMGCAHKNTTSPVPAVPVHHTKQVIVEEVVNHEILACYVRDSLDVTDGDIKLVWYNVPFGSSTAEYHENVRSCNYQQELHVGDIISVDVENDNWEFEKVIRRHEYVETYRGVTKQSYFTDITNVIINGELYSTWDNSYEPGTEVYVDMWTCGTDDPTDDKVLEVRKIEA